MKPSEWVLFGFSMNVMGSSSLPRVMCWGYVGQTLAMSCMCHRLQADKTTLRSSRLHLAWDSCVPPCYTFILYLVQQHLGCLYWALTLTQLYCSLWVCMVSTSVLCWCCPPTLKSAAVVPGAGQLHPCRWPRQPLTCLHCSIIDNLPRCPQVAAAAAAAGG